MLDFFKSLTGRKNLHNKRKRPKGSDKEGLPKRKYVRKNLTQRQLQRAAEKAPGTPISGATELTGLLTGHITPQSYAYPSHIQQQLASGRINVTASSSPSLTSSSLTAPLSPGDLSVTGLAHHLGALNKIPLTLDDLQKPSGGPGGDGPSEPSLIPTLVTLQKSEPSRSQVPRF